MWGTEKCWKCEKISEWKLQIKIDSTTWKKWKGIQGWFYLCKDHYKEFEIQNSEKLTPNFKGWTG